MPLASTKDLTDTQWNVLDNLIPKPTTRRDGRGRPWKDRRSVLNGILWVLRTGAPWADVPRPLSVLPNLPPPLPAMGPLRSDERNSRSNCPRTEGSRCSGWGGSLQVSANKCQSSFHGEGMQPPGTFEYSAWASSKMGMSESRSASCRLGVEEDFEGFENCYSQRNTFAETAVHTINATASAVRSRACADHASPFQIPSSSDTA